jgi:four helix bundle protein
MTSSILVEKSYAFALRIVRLSQYLNNEKKEFILSRKVLDSGTAIGALIEEARQGEDRADFAQRLGLGAKEAFKTNYWLRLLRDGGHIAMEQAASMLSDCEELQKMLVASRKTTRNAG